METKTDICTPIYEPDENDLYEVKIYSVLVDLHRLAEDTGYRPMRLKIEAAEQSLRDAVALLRV